MNFCGRVLVGLSLLGLGGCGVDQRYLELADRYKQLSDRLTQVELDLRTVNPKLDQLVGAIPLEGPLDGPWQIRVLTFDGQKWTEGSDAYIGVVVDEGANPEFAAPQDHDWDEIAPVALPFRTEKLGWHVWVDKAAKLTCKKEAPCRTLSSHSFHGRGTGSLSPADGPCGSGNPNCISELSYHKPGVYKVYDKMEDGGTFSTDHLLGRIVVVGANTQYVESYYGDNLVPPKSDLAWYVIWDPQQPEMEPSGRKDMITLH